MTAQTMMESISRLTLAIATAAQELDRIDTELLALEGNTCNGTIHWRNPSDGSAPMMYANHRHGESCPLHGSPLLSNGRLRVYVGIKPGRQETVTKAMELHKRFIALRHQRTRLNAALNRTYPLDQITQSLQ
jgi:hypothetical protein